MKKEWDIRKYFEELRFDKNHHIGMGDIRLTIAQQDEICENFENKKSIEEIKKAIYQFKKEELPNAEIPFHYEAEIWAGMKSFIKWLK